MCDKCDVTIVNTCIRTKSRTINLCPNHLVEALIKDELDIDEGTFISEVSNKTGAVLISDDGAEYKLLAEEAINLFNRGLSKSEYRKLLKAGHLVSEYLLHDDFYTVNGEAICPVDIDRYNDHIRESEG